MNTKKRKISFDEFKKDIEKEMIKGIIIYAYKDILPNNNPNSYINAYTLVQNYVDSAEDKELEEMNDYHNKIIMDYIKDSNEKITSKLSGIQFIDFFIEKTEKINFLIYWLGRIFYYLNRYYEITKSKDGLNKVALTIYRDKFFLEKQEKLFKEINKLIKEDRNCNLEHRPQLKSIFKILHDLNLINPKISKEQNKIIWISENEKKKIQKKNHVTFGKHGLKTFKKKV